MPDPAQPTPLLLGLQKARSIGPDPKAEAIRRFGGNPLHPVQEAGMPNPESEGLSAVDALSKLVRNYTGPVQETLGEINPFHTPVGGEGMYNAGRVPAVPNTPFDIYQQMMQRFGMGKK